MQGMFWIRSSIVLLSLVFITGQVFAKGESPRYPNELKGLQFYEAAKWKSLTPLVSTMADVRRVLGAPNDARDVDQYTKPYPGDAKAKLPVFTYEMDADWEILVYFVKYSSCECPKLKKTSGDLLYSVELVPKSRIPFAAVNFPPAFKKENVVAVDAAWDEYADGSGLSYHVYTTNPPYGTKKRGDLSRIVYAPSTQEVAGREGKL